MRLPVLSIGRRVRFRHVQAALSEREAPEKMLDAGCGDGRFTVKLAQRYGGASVLGIDPDEGTIDAARAASGQLPNLRFEVGAVGGPDLCVRFDRIVCIDVLEHIRDDQGALCWLARHLAPRGALIVHVPAAGQRHVFGSVARALEVEVDAREGPHYREGYDRADLRAQAARARLAPERLVWTFHRRSVRLAADTEQWIFLHRIKPLKAVLLPMLLLGASLERHPSAHERGNGLLLVAGAPISDRQR